MTPEQIELTKSVLRIKPEEMTNAEFNLGLALLMEHEIKQENDRVFIFTGKKWKHYCPMTNWKQFSEIITKTSLTMGTHNTYDNDNKLTGHWYSAHAQYGGTNTEGYDFRNVVAQTCIKLLAFKLKHS